jgi:hypothetical protein
MQEKSKLEEVLAPAPCYNNVRFQRWEHSIRGFLHIPRNEYTVSEGYAKNLYKVLSGERVSS